MKLSDQMRAKIAGLVAQRSTLHDEQAAILAVCEKRDNKALTDDEQKLYDEKRDAKKTLDTEITDCEARLAEIEDEERRDAKAAESRTKYGTGDAAVRATVTEPDIYAKNGPNSFFRDMLHAHVMQDFDARQRLQRHGESLLETRASGNTNAAGGSGGEWAPPQWVVDEWINIIRPGRVTANLFRHEDVPVGISSLNYPKLTGGTAVGLQSTQNTALASTDPTTSFVQTGFATLGGKNVVSQQLLDQGRNYDAVLTADLGAAYSQQVGTQVFTGTGTGSGTNSVINGLLAATAGSTQTWTQASPTGAGFYGQTGNLLQKFLAARLMPPSNWVMHPRRWFWLESMSDSQGRPFVVPNGQAFNPIAIENGVVAMGEVGTFHGLPVIIDPLVPINQGAGTNQDLVYLIKADDLVLLESPPQVEVFREPYADTLGVLLRMYGYVATILNRHAESIGVLTGTGLVTPTFAS